MRPIIGNSVSHKSNAPEADRSEPADDRGARTHKRKRRAMPVWLVLELIDRAQSYLEDPTRTGGAAVLAPAFQRKIVLSAPPRCGDRRRPSDCPRTRNRLRGCLLSQRGIPLVEMHVLWLRLMSFEVMLGTSLQSAAVEGFGQQPAGPLNIASEPDSARADDVFSCGTWRRQAPQRRDAGAPATTHEGRGRRAPQRARPEGWSPAKRAPMDTDGRWTLKRGRKRAAG